MTTEEIGKRIKLQFPRTYDDLTDHEIGERYLARYPNSSILKDLSEYKNLLPTPIDTSDFREIGSTIDRILAHYLPEIGTFTAWWRTWSADGRNALLVSLNEEQRKVIEQASMLEQEVIQRRRNAAEYNSFIAEHSALFAVLRKASDEGLTLESYSKVKEHERTSQTDYDLKIAEMRETIRLGFLTEVLTEHQKMILVQELIDTIYRQIHSISQEAIAEEIKSRMIGDREEMIATLKEDRRARETRLLQANNREET